MVELIIQQQRAWNIARVQEVFPPHLTQVILKIPLILEGQPDTNLGVREELLFYRKEHL